MPGTTCSACATTSWGWRSAWQSPPCWPTGLPTC
uniref:Uncharacterized protein n=1 Tax=Muribaculaceae bacterium Z82 TaxID=2304548 RepID=A0A7C9NMA8_9BACT